LQQVGAALERVGDGGAGFGRGVAAHLELVAHEAAADREIGALGQHEPSAS
jgi:hypothetical protein